MVEGIAKQNNERDGWRLDFHLMPPAGWMNDPNGLCQYHGEYHVFFQYAPFDANGGIKFWGHYRSKDMLQWHYEEPALFPDQPFDCHGVYSGTAWIEGDNMHLFYTGNVKLEGDYDYINQGRAANTIYAASEDGITFHQKELLMTNTEYPCDCTCHVRDPNVWKRGDRYYMIQGARRKGEGDQERGEILLFAAKDMKNWSLVNRITSEEEFGYMWECPDYFELDGEQILLCCPQGVEPQGIRYQNLYQNGYFAVHGDLAGSCELGEFEELDYGFDFYAPQTFQDEKGRRLLIGWAGMPDVDYFNPTAERGWQHCLTVPRELHFRDGKLYQNPIKELQALRRTEENVEWSKSYKQQGLQSYEAWLQFDTSEAVRIQIQSCGVQNGKAVIRYEPESRLFILEMEGALAAGRDRRVMEVGDLHDIRILADRSILEVYCNGGERVMTTRYYPAGQETSLEIKGEKGHMVLWKLGAFAYNENR